MREIKGLKVLRDSMRWLTGVDRMHALRQSVQLVDVVLFEGTKKLLALYACVSD